jgi:hypothetical protein
MTDAVALGLAADEVRDPADDGDRQTSPPDRASTRPISGVSAPTDGPDHLTAAAVAVASRPPIAASRTEEALAP